MPREIISRMRRAYVECELHLWNLFVYLGGSLLTNSKTILFTALWFFTASLALARGNSVETYRDVLADPTASIAEKKEIVRQIIEWEGSVGTFFPNGTYPKANGTDIGDTRAQYLALLFSNDVLQSKVLSSSAYVGLRDLLREDFSRFKKLNAPASAKEVVMLQAFADLIPDRIYFAASTLEQRADRHFQSLSQQKVSQEEGAEALTKAISMRLVDGGNRVSDFEKILLHARFDSTLRGVRSTPEAKSLISMGHQVPVEIVNEVNRGLPTPKPVPVAPTPKPVVVVPPTPAPTPVAAKPTPAPAPKPVVAVAANAKKIEDWIKDIYRLHELEKKIATSKSATEKAAFVKEADAIFESYQAVGQGIYEGILGRKALPIESKDDRAKKNLFVDEYDNALRKQVFHNLLFGYAPESKKPRGRGARLKILNDTPRTAALAAMGLSYSVHRRIARNGGLKMENALLDVENAYAISESMKALSPKQREDVRKAFSQAKEIYNTARTKSLTPMQRTPRTFVPAKDTQKDLNVLSGDPLEVSQRDYKESLKRIAANHDAEGFMGVIETLKTVEERLKDSLSANERASLNALGDALLETAKAIGTADLKGLPLKGERYQFAGSGAARQHLRKILGQNIEPKKKGTPPTPRLVAASLYGLSASALFEKSAAKPTRIESEWNEVERQFGTLNDSTQKNELVVAARKRLAESKIEANKIVFARANYHPPHPEMRENPVQAGTGNGWGPNKERKPFLQAEWWRKEFIDETPGSTSRNVLSALAKLRPGSGASGTQIKKALEFLKAHKPDDLGHLLALADIFREHRIQDTELFQKPGEDRAAALGNVAAELKPIVTAWATNYKSVKKKVKEADEGEALESELTERLFGVDVSEGGPKSHRKAEKMALKPLNRAYIFSRDPHLMEVATRITSKLNLALMKESDRAGLIERLEAVLLDRDGPFETDRDFKKARGLFVALLKHLKPETKTAKPIATPQAAPSAGVPSSEKLEVEQLIATLNILSGKNGKLPAGIISTAWDLVLSESLKIGITDARAVEALVKWIGDETVPSESRAKGLQLLQNSWDHVGNLLEKNPELAEAIDTLIVETLPSQMKGKGLGAEFKALLDGFKQLRLNKPLPEVIQNVAKKLNCKDTVAKFAAGATRFAAQK